SAIWIASFDTRTSYQLKLFRHRPEMDWAGVSSRGFTSSALRTRSGRASKYGGTFAVSGRAPAGAGRAAGSATSGCPAPTQGRGLKQRPLLQPREARLPAIEVRAPSQAEPDPNGPSRPLLPTPSLEQPEQYQSKE